MTRKENKDKQVKPVMVRFTKDEHKAVKKAAKKKEVAVFCREAVIEKIVREPFY